MSAWAIRHPIPAGVVFAAIIALGVISFTKLPITRMPNVDVPVIVVLISQYGASPAELESQVTKKVEDAVAGVAGARHINSSITDGLSNAEFTSNAMLGWAKDHAVSGQAECRRATSNPSTAGARRASQQALRLLNLPMLALRTRRKSP